jgi:DNA modification methylase
MGGARMMAQMRDNCVDLAFFDPQHRDVLNRQRYGNEGNRQKGRASLPHMDPPTIQHFIGEIERVLKAGRYLMLWVDKYVAAERLWMRWMPEETRLKAVDFICWYKGRIGMGRRSRGIAEYLIVLQLQPIDGARWTDRSIPDCWVEGPWNKHPHSKPIGLIQRLIRATTKLGDLVLDPAAGGFVVLDACATTTREFVGCDLIRSDTV